MHKPSSAIHTYVRSRHRRRGTGWLCLTGLRRCAIYKPLAILLSVLLLPAVSWIEGGAGPRAFQSAAQIISSCAADPSSNSIIRNFCVTTPSGETFDYHNDLVQLEKDAVNSYLSEHRLPPEDAHVIYDFGRSDLRSAVRANMLLILQGIITKASRDTHEQNLYKWLSINVQNNEISMYTNAINEFGKWQSNPCLFTLDPVIASTYNLSYDGVPFCGGTASLFNGAPVPAASYFRAYGLRKSYGSVADQFPYFSSLVAKIAIHAGAILGIVVAVGGGVGVVVAATIVAAAAIGPIYAGVVVTGSTIAAIGAGTLVVGIVAIVLVAISIGVAAGLQLYVQEQTLKDLNNMANTLSQVKTAAPDLLTLASDATGLGSYKLQMTFAAQTVPEIASTAALPAHKNGVDLNFTIQNILSPTFSYKDWDGNTWSVQSWGGWFVQACSGAHCGQTDSILSSIEYVDWSGVKWTASRLGTTFVHTKAQPASTDTPCKADTLTGVSPGSDFSICSSYVSTSIPLTDPRGIFVRVSLSAWAAPEFTNPHTLSFLPGVSSSQTISVTGNPSPAICYTSGNLPAGFTLNGGTCGQGQFRITYDGSAVTQGFYDLTLTATGYGTPVTKTFTIAVTQQLSITSPASFTTVPGVPVNFLVTTTGYPVPSLSLDPAFPWPEGLTFRDNQDGTATISGALTKLGLSACVHAPTDTDPDGAPCGIIASNAQGRVVQSFAINTSLAPQAFVVPPTSATFIAGIPNSVVLSSTGAITPVTTWVFRGNANAPWAGLQSNVFDRTATLSGTPPVGTTGSFTVDVAPFALYSASDPSLVRYTTYTINVSNTPFFTSPHVAAFTAGTFGSFPVSVNMGTVSLADSLPQGLSFIAGTINGAAAQGTGGQYTVRLIDDAGTAGSITQYLNLDVYEKPQITSPNTATFIAGTPGSYAVTATGFPSISTHAVSPTSLPPTSTTQGNGMYFTVTGLPSGLQASNLTPQGFAGGTLTIQGTVTSANAGTYPVQITAQNGVGTSQQALTIHVISIAGPAPVSGTKCNGNYNGTFRGNITVSAGQNCVFVAGGVDGNVTVNGGNLALTNANVTGVVTIQGASGFSIGPASTIGKNLTIQNVASGSTQNRVCQAKVAGNLQVYTNAIPISIGSRQNFCYGNSVDGSVDMQGNTAPLAVYDNLVGKNLACSNNTSITGAGNSAQKKNGQCAAF